MAKPVSGKQKKAMMKEKKRLAKLKNEAKIARDEREKHLWRNETLDPLEALARLEKEDESDHTPHHTQKKVNNAFQKPKTKHGKRIKMKPQNKTHNESKKEPKKKKVIPYYNRPTIGDLKTVFAREDNKIVEKRKLESRLPLQRVEQGEFVYFEALDFPVRPPWTHGVSKDTLEKQEQEYFDIWLRNIYETYNVQDLNHFEHNLLVWKQLWRVTERSDIILVVADARHPHVGFNSAIYNYVMKILSKPVILVLTKTDLIPSQVLQQWHIYLKETYPGLRVVDFSCCPWEEKSQEPEMNQIKLHHQRWRKGMTLPTPAGMQELERVCAEVAMDINSNLNVSEEASEHFSLNRKFPKSRRERQQMQISDDTYEGIKNYDDDNDDDNDDDELDKDIDVGVLTESDGESDDELLVRRYQQTEYMKLHGNRRMKETNYITLGTIGQPNAGKSSLINSLTGRKVVSVSESPGHTKYLQTIFINKFVRLCDCPGLVFPAVGLPREWQVIQGTYPIAQVREPFSAIQFLASRIPIEKIYRLAQWIAPLEKYKDGDDVKINRHKRCRTGYDSDCDSPSEGEDEEVPIVWSGYLICEAYALKKGYFNKSGTLDCYRAGKEILKHTVNGRITMAFQPPKDNSDTILFKKSIHKEIDSDEDNDDEDGNEDESDEEESDNDDNEDESDEEESDNDDNESD